jgi:2-dehydro-3-deoxyphosphogluconate aldolase/(4S)-4-hydroxy-2-oxoglutarate aldolase
MIGDALGLLRAAGVIAVLRAPSAVTAVRAVDALVAGGITGIEITYSTPDAAEAIAEVDQRHGASIYLGAGTVLNEQQARESVEAGARFLVSPGNDTELTAAMINTGATVLAGALTPSEVMAIRRCGAHATKLFPASLGGPSYLRSLRGPFPDMAFVPTGGVNAGNLVEWFAAGALAVGAGGELCPAASMASARWEEITAIAAGFASALERAQAVRG